MSDGKGKGAPRAEAPAEPARRPRSPRQGMLARKAAAAPPPPAAHDADERADPDEGDTQFVSAVARAAQVLNAFRPNDPPLGNVELAERTGRSAPDSHTLYFGANSTLTMAPGMQRTKPFDPVADFTAIGLVTLYANVMWFRADGRFKSLQWVIAYARQNPGRVSYGSAGPGTAGQLSAESLCQKAGVRMTHVPYRGNAPALNDLMGGRIDFLFDFTGTAVAQVQGGRVRAMAVTSATRNAALPDVPTVAESGLKDHDVSGRLALLGPPALPGEVVGKLASAHGQVVRSEEFLAAFKRNGYDAADPAAAALRERIAREQTLWEGVIKTAGIRPE